jgi:hypothetical protein
MPRRFLRGSALRLLLTVLALASGVALVCAIDLVNRAVGTAFTEILDTMAGRVSLEVDGGEGALVPETLADTLKSVAGVELAVPVVSSWAFLADGSGEHLAVHGVDITNDDAVRAYEPAGTDAAGLAEPLEFLAQRDSVMVTDIFAKRHGLEPTGNLDSRTGQTVLELLQRLNRERRLTIVMVTHSTVAAGYGDRTVELKDGRIERDDRVGDPRRNVRD